MKKLSFALHPYLATFPISLPITAYNQFVKTFLFFLFFIAIAIASYSQQIDTAQKHKTEVDLLQKSRTQQTWGWILSGAGLAGLAVTAGLEAGETLIEIFRQEDVSNYTAPYVISAAAIAGGISFIVAASNTKKRAAASTVSLKMENVHGLKPLGLDQKTIPAIALRFKVGK